MRWKPLLVAASLAASIGIGSYDYLARLEVEARVDAELQEAKPRELRRILRENNKPYRHLVERSELEKSAAAALIQVRMRQASVVALLHRAATSVDIGSDVALVCGYLLTILGVPLAVTCLCLRTPFDDTWQQDYQATQPPWVPLHRMRASDTQVVAQNPFARPNPIDPWRLPGPGWSTVPWVNDAVDGPSAARATAKVVEREKARLRAALTQATVEVFAKAPDGGGPNTAVSQLAPEETGADEDAKVEDISKEEEEEEEEEEAEEGERVCGVCLGLLWEQPGEDGHEPLGDSGDEEMKQACGEVATQPHLGAKCLRLACDHVYHHRCLDRWLVEWRGGQCPTCRADVM